MDDMSVLTVDGLRVSYGPIMALRGCTLEVRQGETVAVVGANGAGKTTLLHAICNMVAWTGSICLAGAATNRIPTHQLARRGVLYLPENRGIFATQTVFENLRLAFDMSPGERSFVSAVEEVFTHFPRLGERREQQAGSMSGGEQQMLALARAVLSEPRILLLTSHHLDCRHGWCVKPTACSAASKREKWLSCSSSKNVKMALSFADRGYVLRQGLIVRHGDAAALARDGELFSQYLG